MKLGLTEFLASALFAVALSPVASAQSMGAPPLPSTLGRSAGTGWITVYLRSENEMPISAVPQISLTSAIDDTVIPQFPHQVANGWVFTGLPTGSTYDLDVKVDGFEPVHETVLISDTDYATANVVVILRPINEQLVFHAPTGQFVLAPRAQKEVQQGLRDLRSGKIPSAQKHFQKAIGLAPGNPYVNYVMGMSYLLAKQLPNAQPYLEESVSLDPTQVASLLALGTLRFQQASYPGAIEVLSKAAELDPSSWKSQWLLATSYLYERDYTQARDHAEKALAVGKEQTEPVRLILAEAAAGMGDRAGALVTLNSFLSVHPQDRDALKLRAWLGGLPKPSPVTEEKPVASSTVVGAARLPQPQPVVDPPPPPATELPPKPDWAPPDIDAERPFTVSGAGCSLPKVLKSAGRNATELATDLEKFSSREEYEAVEIKRDASLERPVSRTYSYMVFIEHPNSRIIHVNEFRDQGTTAEEMPGELADMGAPGLVLAFHPLLQGDFAWSCEGLGKWQGKPAWIVRFEQRSDRSNRLLAFESSTGTHSLPLKGRAWVSENGGQVMHLETDLVAPIPELRLKREHFVIDYKAVAFPKRKVTLWLPENVDVYFHYRGHYLRHYHHFSDFQLFWTGATQKIGQPKNRANLDPAKKTID